MDNITEDIRQEILLSSAREDPDAMLSDAQKQIETLTQKKADLFMKVGRLVLDRDDARQDYPDFYEELAQIKEALDKSDENLRLATREIERRRAEHEAEEARLQTEREAQAGRVCPKCGTAGAEDSKFCRECGAKLEAPPRAQAVCAKCGFSLGPDMRFCQNCGAPRAQTRSFCPGCGRQCAPGSCFCRNCGLKLL